jgi:IclR family acetate operon transcriptional repressor
MLQMSAAVGYAFKVLEMLGTEARPFSFGELQTATGIEKSALSRALTALQEGGYVRRAADSELISLSLRLPAVALGFLEKLGMLEMCQPVLTALAEETGELVQLATSDGGRPTYIAKAQGKKRIQALPLIGTAAHPHASAAGKLWLASKSDFEAIAFVQKAELPQLTGKTKIEPEAVIADIRQIRARGYAIIIDEISEGVSGVGVPLQTNRFVGALVLASPTYRAPENILAGYVPALRAKADSLASVIAFCLDQRGADSKDGSNPEGEVASGYRS